jgi:cation diffusion facilitator family transporter
MHKRHAALISVVSNTSLILFKLVAGVLMGSVAVLSEALHSAMDLLASLVAYFSIRQADVPADAQHPYGHGKFENISGFFEAILIFVAAGLIIYGAINKIIHPSALQKLDWGIAVMMVSSGVNLFVSRALFRIGKRERSIALEADALHLWADVLTSVGVLGALLVIKFTGFTLIDPLMALAVAGLIIHAAWDMTRRSLHDLADTSLPPEELESIHRLIATYPQISGFHKLRSRRSGRQRELDLHIELSAALSLHEAHAICHRLEDDIKKALPGIYVTIHAEPRRQTDHDGPKPL